MQSCLECESGYVMENSKCVEKKEDSNKCGKGYYYQGGYCFPCGSFCRECDQNGLCYLCDDGYYPGI